MAKKRLAFEEVLHRYLDDLELMIYGPGESFEYRLVAELLERPETIDDVRRILWNEIINVKRTLVANDAIDHLLRRGIYSAQGCMFVLATTLRPTDWIRTKRGIVRAHAAQAYEGMYVLLNSGAVISHNGCFVGYCERYLSIEITPRHQLFDGTVWTELSYRCDFSGDHIVRQHGVCRDTTAAQEERCVIRLHDVIDALKSNQSIYWTPDMQVTVPEESPSETRYYLDELDRESEQVLKHTSDKAA